MLGSADKVDRTRDGVLLVTDIKTGRATKFVELKDDPVAAGTKLQLPVYAYAARAAPRWQTTSRRSIGSSVGRTHSSASRSCSTTTWRRSTPRRSPPSSARFATGYFVPKPPAQAAYGWVDCEYCTPGGYGHDDARSPVRAQARRPAASGLIAARRPAAGRPEGGDTA